MSISFQLYVYVSFQLGHSVQLCADIKYEKLYHESQGKLKFSFRKFISPITLTILDLRTENILSHGFKMAGTMDTFRRQRHRIDHQQTECNIGVYQKL